MGQTRVAIIGASWRTSSFCEYIANNKNTVKVVGLADPNTKRAELLNNWFKLNVGIYDNCEDLIARNDVDAVMVSTPDYAHTQPTVAALKANKHVYLEKPLAITIEDCDKIIQAASNSKSICYMGHNMRYSPIHEKAYELIQEGKLGKITTIEADEWYYGGKTYFRRWNRLRKFSGGLWLTKACHDFDLLNWLAGGKPARVYARASLSHYKAISNAGPRCRDCTIKNGCPDFFDINKPEENQGLEVWRQLQLRMDHDGEMAPDICLFNSEKDTFDNGIAVIEYNNDVRATYTVNVLASRSTRLIRIIGTQGMVEGDIESCNLSFTQRHTGIKTVYDFTQEMNSGHGGADTRILDDFFNMCVNGGTPRVALSDGRLAVELGLAARESSDTGRVVELVK